MENCAEPVPSASVGKCVQLREGAEAAAGSPTSSPAERDRKDAQTQFNISKKRNQNATLFQHLGEQAHKNNENFISSFRRMSQ